MKKNKSKRALAQAAYNEYCYDQWFDAQKGRILAQDEPVFGDKDESDPDFLLEEEAYHALREKEQQAETESAEGLQREEQLAREKQAVFWASMNMGKSYAEALVDPAPQESSFKVYERMKREEARCEARETASLQVSGLKKVSKRSPLQEPLSALEEPFVKADRRKSQFSFFKPHEKNQKTSTQDSQSRQWNRLALRH